MAGSSPKWHIGVNKLQRADPMYTVVTNVAIIGKLTLWSINHLSLRAKVVYGP